MRIVCPICSATYEVRDGLLVPGRSVRCARCGEEWVALATSPPPTQEVEQSEQEALAPPEKPPAAPPRLTAMDRLASHPAPLPRPNLWLRAAWAASLVLVGLLVVGLIVWRTEVTRVWPPAVRLYDAIGMGPAPPQAH